MQILLQPMSPLNFQFAKKRSEKVNQTNAVKSTNKCDKKVCDSRKAKNQTFPGNWIVCVKEGLLSFFAKILMQKWLKQSNHSKMLFLSFNYGWFLFLVVCANKFQLCQHSQRHTHTHKYMQRKNFRRTKKKQTKFFRLLKWCVSARQHSTA